MDKTCVVTGANSGIGLATARRLALRGFEVVITARDREKGVQAVQQITADVVSANVHLCILDLASLANVGEAASGLLSQVRRLDVLINNAGIHDLRGGVTKDGFQLTYGTNYIGPFALTSLLLGRLLETAKAFGEARVVNVSSSGHRMALRFDPENPLPHPWPRNREPYTESKLANILHALELARRFGNEGLRAHAVDPGYVATNIGRREHWPGMSQWLFTLTRPWQKSANAGAEPSIFAATSEQAGQSNGKYWTGSGEQTPRLPADADRVAERLWDRTEELIAASDLRTA